MHAEVKVDEESRKAEVSAPDGCPTCDGPLELRLTAQGGWGYCASCHRISRAGLQLGPEGVTFVHPAAEA